MASFSFGMPCLCVSALKTDVLSNNDNNNNDDYHDDEMMMTIRIPITIIIIVEHS